MPRSATLAVAAALLTLSPTAAPASQKPCRDKTGKVIDCPKPRAPTHRCKDDKGRFVACPGSSKDAPAKP